MPYTRISPSRNGREAIEYALGGKEGRGHNMSLERNVFITSVGMSQEPPSYAEQMSENWRLASSRNKNQVRRVIISFDKQELDPDDPNSSLIAGELARDFFREYYPDRQTLICVQKDGVGGCLHIHGIVNNVSSTDHKGCTDEQTKFHYVAKGVDEVAKNYINLSMDYKDKWDEKTGKAILPKDKVNQNVRRMRDENLVAEAHDEQPPHYIWQDDLKGRVKTAIDESSSKEDFEKRLTANGVELGRQGHSKKHGDYFTYELVDTTNFPEPPTKDLKVRSYNLGDDYTPDALQRHLDEIKPKEVVLEGYRELTPEEKERQAELEAYYMDMAKWAHENGLPYKRGDKWDFAYMESVKDKYDEYLLHKDDVQDAEPELEVKKSKPEEKKSEPAKKSKKQEMIEKIVADSKAIMAQLEEIMEEDEEDERQKELTKQRSLTADKVLDMNAIERQALKQKMKQKDRSL